MDRERLNTLLQEPTAVGATDVAGLRELAGRYPWFSGAGAADGGRSGHGRCAVRRASAPGGRPPAQPGACARPGACGCGADPPSTGDTGGCRTADRADDAGARGARTWGGIPEPVHEEPTAGPSAALGATSELAAQSARPAQPPPAPPDDLDDQIRSAALATVYDLTWSATQAREEVPEPTAPVPAEEPAPPTAAVPPDAERPSEAPLHASTRPERMRFTAWLEEAPEVTAPATVSAAPRKVVADALTPKASPAQPIPGGMDTKALIERFIQGQAPPAARKAEFFTPQQAGKRSLEEHAELVTEILARLYEQQGDTTRAAAAYRRLAERHPQRRAEFLARAIAAEGGNG
ncbi:MAG: hypothetical protein IPM68_05650 [Flavobacteriales bacterium]|nr:hypothetical protein [Flavobacteriales bacterium]